MFQAMLLSVAIAISFAICSTEAFQPHRLIKTSAVIKQGIKMSIAPPEFLELSNTLNVASFSVLPSSVLNTDLIFSFAHENAPIVFWIVNVLIFNLAKGGQTYPIGPLALPEGTTEYPTLFNKVYNNDISPSIHLSIRLSIYHITSDTSVVALVFLWASVCCSYLVGRSHWNHRVPIR